MSTDCRGGAGASWPRGSSEDPQREGSRWGGRLPCPGTRPGPGQREAAGEEGDALPLDAPFVPFSAQVCGLCPVPPACDVGTDTPQALSGRLAGLQDEGSCRTAGGTRVWAGMELRALGAIATAVRGFTSGALRDLTYDLSHLPLSRPSLGEDACPGHSPSWENN